ncbi:MAG: rRNA maturation RNase YbeY [Chitinophagaceae bacterium]
MTGDNQIIDFSYLTPVSNFKNRNVLKEFIRGLIQQEGHTLDCLTYIFCTDDYLLNYNKQYLNHDTLTDIITFQLNQNGFPLLADVYISIDRVKENALTYHNSFSHELHRVIFHGALHLCGYGDKTPSEQKIMTQKENDYVQNYFVPRETF